MYGAFAVNPKLEAFRKRIARLWRVAPYLVDVEPTGHEGTVKIRVGGAEPTPQQLEMIKEDLRRELATPKGRGMKGRLPN